MPYAFETRSRVGHQVRAIAGQQVEKALELAGSDGGFDKTVHALRRRCKKLRGLLRLVQPNFDDYGRENAALREAADLLGGARDARVMVETLDGLVVAGHSQAAREFLVSRADEIAEAERGANTLRRFSQIFGKLEKRAADWSFDANGFDLIGDGLEKTYRQFRHEMTIAESEHSAHAMHEWRKRAKHHFFHVSLLKTSAPDLLGERVETLDSLGERLGDHHNLAVLADTLTGAQGRLGEIGPILAAIEQRQAQLATDALALGQQIAAEKPSALRTRFEAYWALLPKEA